MHTYTARTSFLGRFGLLWVSREEKEVEDEDWRINLSLLTRLLCLLLGFDYTNPCDYMSTLTGSLRISEKDLRKLETSELQRDIHLEQVPFWFVQK